MTAKIGVNSYLRNILFFTGFLIFGVYLFSGTGWKKEINNPEYYFHFLEHLKMFFFFVILPFGLYQFSAIEYRFFKINHWVLNVIVVFISLFLPLEKNNWSYYEFHLVQNSLRLICLFVLYILFFYFVFHWVFTCHKKIYTFIKYKQIFYRSLYIHISLITGLLFAYIFWSFIQFFLLLPPLWSYSLLRPEDIGFLLFYNLFFLLIVRSFAMIKVDYIWLLVTYYFGSLAFFLNPFQQVFSFVGIFGLFYLVGLFGFIIKKLKTSLMNVNLLLIFFALIFQAISLIPGLAEIGQGKTLKLLQTYFMIFLPMIWLNLFLWYKSVDSLYKKLFLWLSFIFVIISGSIVGLPFLQLVLKSDGLIYFPEKMHAFFKISFLGWSLGAAVILVVLAILFNQAHTKNSASVITYPTDIHRRENNEPEEADRPWGIVVWMVMLTLVVWGTSYFVLFSGGGDVQGGDRRSLSVASQNPPSASDVSGEQVYQNVCMACHQSQGQGLAGTFPPLAGSEWVLKDAKIPVKIVLHGLKGPITVKDQVYNGVMPAFAQQLSDQEIAAVVSYIRSSWGNNASSIAENEVSELRKKWKDKVDAWTATELTE